MRRAVILVALLAGCKGDQLRNDMKVFCRAADVTHSGSILEIGPYVAQRVKSPELINLFALDKNSNTTIEQFMVDARALVAKAGLDECATLDIMAGKAKLLPR